MRRDPRVPSATLPVRSNVWGKPDIATRIIEFVGELYAARRTNKTQTSMSFVAIIGSAALGAAVAHALAVRDRIREIRLIDSEERVAQGKALDIRQSSAIDQFATLGVGRGAIAA